MAQDSHDLWAQCLLHIERQVSPQTFNTWFRPTTVRRFDSEKLIIEVPSSYFADWVENKYLELIRQAVYEITKMNPRISFAIVEECSVNQNAIRDSPGSFSSSQDTSTNSKITELLGTKIGAELHGTTQGNLSHSSLITPLNERYTFETFVIGEGNRFAHAAAHAVAQSPGKTQFNPLVIYGGVGLGKTHLLQAIGNYALKQHRAQLVAFVPSEKFMSDFIEAIKNQKTAEFRNLYRSPDILLVDDIQFLLKGESTQNEFFHTFNALHQSGKQIVMTCDSPPGQLKGMEERLVSRFQWGLVTPIEPPDLETRIAILHQKAEINGIVLPQEVAVFLGNFISSNIRELEGALIHLMAYCSVNQIELSVEAARQIVQERVPIHDSKLNIEAIQQHVAEHFNLTSDLLIGKTRKQEIANARQIAMFLAKKLTNNPLKVIGLHFGNRDHSTVIHAIQTIEKRCKLDRDFAQMIDKLSEGIQNKYQVH